MAIKNKGTRQRKTVVTSSDVIVGNGRPAALEATIRQLLAQLGEDPERHGLAETPKRIAKSLAFLTRGYQQDSDV